jgi:hypothetical protein
MFRKNLRRTISCAWWNIKGEDAMLRDSLAFQQRCNARLSKINSRFKVQFTVRFTRCPAEKPTSLHS